MISIALISDIHFGKDARSAELSIPDQKIKDDVTGAKPLYGTLSEKLSAYKPQYLFCAGDLTSAGKPLEYKYCLEKLYKLAGDSGIPQENVVYCIGNHDVDWTLMDLVNSRDEYKQLEREFNDVEVSFLEKYYSGISHAWLQNYPYLEGVSTYCDIFSSTGPVPMTGIIERDDLMIFVLNSGFLCSNSQEFIHGKITFEQYEWLEEELKKRANKKVWKIVILHHHPFNYVFPIQLPEYSTLEEGPRLQKICGENGVNLVIHGHFHYPMAKTTRESNWNNAVTFISAGSLSVNYDERSGGNIPNTFHILQLMDYPNVMKLITYEYVLGDGWKKVSHNRKELPLDSEMFYGELTIDDERAKTLIRNFPTNRPITYEEIDKELKYLPPSHLNALLKEVHGLNLSGSFPDRIQIHSSKEGGNV